MNCQMKKKYEKNKKYYNFFIKLPGYFYYFVNSHIFILFFYFNLITKRLKYIFIYLNN